MKRLVVVVLMALLGLLAPAVPAAATDHPLELSRDGSTWSDRLDGGVFDSAVRWVPGDSRVVAFHVRNGGDSPSDFSLAVLSDDAHQLFARGLFTITARLGDDPWVEVDELDTDYRLTTAALPVAASRRVEVAVDFTEAGDNLTQTRVLPLDFRLRLTDAAVRIEVAGSEGATPGASGGQATPDGVLPATGAPETRGALLGAAALVGVGLGLLAARRRRDEDEDRDEDQGARHGPA